MGDGVEKPTSAGPYIFSAILKISIIVSGHPACLHGRSCSYNAVAIDTDRPCQ